MARVRLYEDVDGCLNADSNAYVWRDKENPEDLGGFMQGWGLMTHMDDGTPLTEYHTSQKYRMRWNSRLIDALNTLDVEFVWATTWRADGPRLAELMGLLHDPQRVLHPLSGVTTFPSIEWKMEAILHEQDHDPSPFIAVDDEWYHEPEYTRDLESIGGLVISPNPNFGIEPADIEKMRAYIAQS